LGVREVASRLSVSTRTVYALCERGESHVLAYPIADEPLRTLTVGDLETHLRKLEKTGARNVRKGEKRGLGAASVNHVRKNLRTAFNKARKAGEWKGPNLAADTEARTVATRIYDTLSADEALAMLANLPPQWKGFFAVALYAGLRKGECAGMRKTDVDLAQGLLNISASYDDDTTKGKHADVLPIAPPLRPYLEAALKSPGQYLFPDEAGKMRGPESDPQDVLRTALAAGGIVKGYDHTCRRKSCRQKGKAHVERHADKAQRDCPRCGMKLWPKAIKRGTRFHDLRHTCATLLFRAHVDAHHVQRILRHASITTTTSTYAHLMAEDLREALDVLPAPANPMEVATRLLPETNRATEASSEARDFSSANDDLENEPRGNRTHDPRLKRPVLCQLS